MPDETEVIQSDVSVEFRLPNDKVIPGKPVPYPEARKIMAQLFAFEKSGDYVGTLQQALDRFSALTGITDEQVMALCPDMTLGELVGAIQLFFFRRRHSTNGRAAGPTMSKVASGV